MNQTPNGKLPTHRRINRPLAIASIGWFVIIIVLLLAAAIVPPGKVGGMPAAFYYLLLLGIGVCIFTVGFVYSYNAWTKNAQDYLAWFSQETGATKSQVAWASRNPNYTLWQTRLVPPLGMLFGLALAVLAIYSILFGWPIR